MKQISFTLAHDEAFKGALNMLVECPRDGSMEVVFRNAKTSKTLAQLGGLFGCWETYIAEQTGDSEHLTHRKLKARFLARIYCMEPHGDAQEQWVELLAHYQELGDNEKLLRHAKRISVSWASISQMNAFMTAVERYYQDKGFPLPILDKFRKFYK